MKKHLRVLLPILTILALSAGIYFYQTMQQAKPQPDVIDFIQRQGVQVIDQFNTPSDMIGYAAVYQGEPMSIYITPDKKYAVIGDLIDAEGNDLGADAIYRLVSAPQNEKIWQQLEQANWVQDGSPAAKQVIYTFTDPFCPYCHKFRELADKAIQSGHVQFRHILVGILQEDSLAIAATIMGSSSPQDMLAQHRQHYASGGISLDQTAASKGNDVVLQNNQLMEKLHLHATPATFYRDKDDQIHHIEGLPSNNELNRILQH